MATNKRRIQRCAFAIVNLSKGTVSLSLAKKVAKEVLNSCYSSSETDVLKACGFKLDIMNWSSDPESPEWGSYVEYLSPKGEKDYTTNGGIFHMLANKKKIKPA